MAQSRHFLLTALIATTIVVTAALSWAGWRLLVQQQAIDRQRANEQLERIAAEMTARLRGRLAEAGERLSASLAEPSAPPPSVDGAVVLTFAADALLVGGAGLPFVPAVPASPLPGDFFAEGESFEFARGDFRAAADHYRRLARNRDVRIRAEAQLRLGRVLRKSGNLRAALRTYEQLTGLGSVRTAGLPAELVGLYLQRATWLAMRGEEQAQQLTRQLRKGLDEGRWLITRGFAELYRDELGLTTWPPSWVLADALERAWSEHEGRFSARGQRVFGTEAERVLVMWRSAASRSVVMAARVDDLLPWRDSDGVRWQLADPEGGWIAGDRSVANGAATRIVGDSDYPWTLHVASGDLMGDGQNSQATLIAMMTTVLLCVWGATYMMARAIRREAAVARLQSDFVAAVSHEFRSPLTAIRQMAEMLEMGRVPGDDRRQTYYRVLAREAGRLQRLVETLLNFGRMEAGAARYQFGSVDAASLIQGVVRDIEPVAREAGKRIEIAGPDAIAVRADESALAVALRNLIDNAIKYSPDEPVVRVEWLRDNGRAAIRVVDRGAGIPRAEHEAVFRKFVRGRSAIEGNVKGTGVGLSMVQQIVAAHDGEIHLDSDVGRGSTFTLLLPLAG